MYHTAYRRRRYWVKILVKDQNESGKQQSENREALSKPIRKGLPSNISTLHRNEMSREL